MIVALAELLLQQGSPATAALEGKVRVIFPCDSGTCRLTKHDRLLPSSRPLPVGNRAILARADNDH